MFTANTLPEYKRRLDPCDVNMLGIEAAIERERFMSCLREDKETPLLSLANLAQRTGIATIHIKDEGHRLGLGSFKALGGSYAVIRQVLDEASRRLAAPRDVSDLFTPEVKAVAESMAVACATDGNHGRSVAQGAQLVGAHCVIFVHAGVSEERVAAIARYGAEIVRVAGAYDDSVAEASRTAGEKGWIVVSDTSWPGYERIPGLVMQGYTALLREALRQIPQPPTHVFIQAGVGGVAAATAGHFSIVFGDNRPTFIVVEPSRAACIFESVRAGKPIKIVHGQPTVMSMLECYEPSLVAWRVLSRAADAFMTVEENDAVDVMNRLAFPMDGDPAIVAGESGGVGLAGLLKAAADPEVKGKLGLGSDSRVFLINTEGATDPVLYAKLVGVRPEHVAGRTGDARKVRDAGQPAFRNNR
jgi:diaminopropionate ammonia-lyase